ncbi:DEKNAAC102758 [Brettanomyces naardenensis]|uniref:DEKNAAC102758 n=1 Tax=Brettanomyces naardenensis TaxID=13370 RepID=A0A448YLD9_BRENA|nr:DEKNAAC102758 [Brettanomyces naardenensis]
MTDVPDFRFDGEVTVVTGACGGLAEALIQGLLAYGSDIALFDLNQAQLDKSIAQFEKYATQTLKLKKVPTLKGYICNVSDAAKVEEAFQKVHKDFGKYPLHLVNTAGYCENYPAEKYPAKNAAELIGVNLLGSLYVAQSWARPLIEHKIEGASAVMIGSMSGNIVNDPQPQICYNMSKAGVIHMVKTLASEWAKYKIRVNTLSPGYISGPLTAKVIEADPKMYDRWMSMVPMHRMSEPKEFTGTILYLLSNAASSYTTGANIIADGGYACW